MRFVLANLRAGKFQDGLKRRSRDAAGEVWDQLAGDADIVGDYDPADELARRVVLFDADPSAVQAATLSDDVTVEPEVVRYPLVAPLPPDLLPDPDGEHLAALVVSSHGSSTFTASVVTTGGRPVDGADVSVVVTIAGQRRTYAARSDTAGKVTVNVPPTAQVYALVVEPYESFWPTVLYQPQVGATVVLSSLPSGTVAWQADAVGESRYVWNVGSGIVVGVADTGCGPHPALSHVKSAGAFVNGRVDQTPDSFRDVDVHGSHVSGTIAGRGKPAGIAPGVGLWVARVFGGADSGASSADIVNAVDALSRGHQAHLINLSLGSAQSSKAEHDSIVDAAERGTLVICAAGNDGGPVGYPASYDEAAAVSALGRDGTAPSASISAMRKPADPALVGQGGYWLADFSDRGVQVDAAGPGVGVVASVPVRAGSSAAPFTALDGTSMASPSVTAALAVVLSRDGAFRKMPRDRSRTERARRLLASASLSVGLAQPLQGAGLPHI